MAAHPHDEVDWFGLPYRPPRARTPVPCPRCGEPFIDAEDLRRHVARAHHIRVRRYPLGAGRHARLRRWWDSLGFLPLWLVLPLNALLVALVTTGVWPVDGWWAVYAGGLSTLPLVLVLAHRQGR